MQYKPYGVFYAVDSYRMELTKLVSEFEGSYTRAEIIDHFIYYIMTDPDNAESPDYRAMMNIPWAAGAPTNFNQHVALLNKLQAIAKIIHYSVNEALAYKAGYWGYTKSDLTRDIRARILYLLEEIDSDN